MFSFFKRKPSATHVVDIHSHLIPSVDDGSKSLEDSLFMLQELHSLGYKKVITTPHIYSDVFPNKEVDLTTKFLDLKAEIGKLGLDLTLELAAEYYVDENFVKKLKGKNELLYFGNRFVLIETSFSMVPFIWDEAIFELKSQGYQPILAHPERYHFAIDDKELLHKWRESGIKLQVSAPSLVGAYGLAEKKLAKYLIKEKLVDALGSDLHNRIQLKGLMKAHEDNSYRQALKLPLINFDL